MSMEMSFIPCDFVDAEPVGSRVTCSPPPSDTDQDVLVLIDGSDGAYITAYNAFRAAGWLLGNGVIYVRPEGGGLCDIATVRGWGDEQQANTSLIASSPRLYAALERLLTGCESIAPVMSRSELHELRLSVIEARAALNQARGEA